MMEDKKKSNLERVLSLGYTKEILMISIILCLIFLTLAFIDIQYVPMSQPEVAGDPSTRPKMPPDINLPLETLDWAMIAAMAFFGPFGFYVSHKQKQIEKIERRLPDFLRDVAEAGRFGMTLADAIVVSSSGRYGKLTPEIKKMAAQIEWGVPANQALNLFAERVDTPLVNRVVAIIIKANDAGGNVADVLNMVSKDAKQVHMSEDEQKIAMTSYLAVIYISYAVFIVVIIILSSQFLSQMAQAGTQLQGGEMSQVSGGGGMGADIKTENIPVIKYIFALAVFAHGIGDGLVAGVLQSGKITNGMKHSFILILIGFVSLRILFGGLGLMV